MKKILLVNDDGIESPGIHALACALQDDYDIRIVAPAHQQSGMSHALSANKKIKVEKFEFDQRKTIAYRVYGTPADCTKLGLEVFFKDDLPDMVISGINDGANLGTDVIYSGTVGAAGEGYAHGIFSVAVSLPAGAEFSFDDAAAIFRHKLPSLYQKGVHGFYNINFPRQLKDEEDSFRYTFQGQRRYENDYRREKDWQGNVFYFMAGAPDDSGNKEGSDVQAFEDGYISITPLGIDRTNGKILEMIKNDAFSK